MASDERDGADRARWMMLLTVMLGSIAGILSSTMIMVAVPAISRHFGIGQASVQWGVSAYMLAMTLSMLLTPWLLLRFGLRRTYVVAVALLLSGGIMSGASASFPMLLCMRVLEGVASGIVQPIPVIVILMAFPISQQGKAMGLYGLSVVVLPCMGPWIGGLLIEAVGWRSIFFVGGPICLLALTLPRRHLPSKQVTATSHGVLDWRSLLLLGAGVIALLNGMARFLDQRILALVLVAAGLAFIAVFAMTQLRRRAGALLDMRLFTHRQFAMGALVSFTYGMGVFGSTYLLPVYLQLGLRYTSAQAGLILMPAGLVLALTIVWAGRMTERWPPHLMIAGGLLVLAASFALMTVGATVPSYTALMWLTILSRIGLGLILPALSLGPMRGIDASLIAQGATAINFLRQLGGAIGVSLVGIVLEWRLAAHAEPGSISTQAGRIDAFNETLMTVAAICALSILAALAMRPPCVDPVVGDSPGN